MLTVAAQMQLADPLGGARIVEQSESANLVGHQHILASQLRNLCDGVLPMVAAVYVHGFLVYDCPIGTPLDVVLDEDCVDALELLSLDDAEVLRLVFEQEVPVVVAEVQELHLGCEDVGLYQLEPVGVHVVDMQLVFVSGGGYSQQLAIQGQPGVAYDIVIAYLVLLQQSQRRAFHLHHSDRLLLH